LGKEKRLTYPEAADNPPCLVKGQSHHHPTMKNMKIMFVKLAVLGIRIRTFFGLPDLVLLVRGTRTDPDPSLSHKGACKIKF
jgi:hypothetical protein